jgi:uncharacterized protein
MRALVRRSACVKHMSSNLKIPSPWTQLALFLLLIGGAMILAVGTINLIPGVHQGQIPTDPGTMKLVQAVTSIILFGLPALTFAMMTFKDHPFHDFGLRPAPKPIYYLLGVLLLFFAFPLEGWLGILNQRIALASWMTKMETDRQKEILTMLQIRHPYDLIVNLLVVSVLAGIFEELCFRGVLQRIMIHICRSPWAGILITACLFSAIHFQFEGFLPRMFLGILLGAAYWYSGSLWTPIIAHIFFNGIQVVAAAWYPQTVTENPSVPVYSALISLVIVVGLLAYMRRQSTVTYAQIYQPTSE